MAGRSQASGRSSLLESDYGYWSRKFLPSQPDWEFTNTGLPFPLKDMPAAGDAAITLGDVTLSSTGTVLVQGAAAITLDALTLSSAGVVPIVGTASITLDAITLAADGTVTGGGGGPVTGDAAITLADMTLSAAGVVAVQGTFATTLGDVTLSSAGVLPVTGNAAITLSAVVTSAQGSVALTGQAAITLAALTLVADNATGTGVPALLFPPLLVDATNPQMEAWPMDTLTVDTFTPLMPVSASNVQLEAKALNEKMTV